MPSSPPQREVGVGRLTVEELAEPVKFLETWCGLYDELIRRHGLKGMSRFSREAFELQFAVPGLIAFRAVDDEGDTVGMLLLVPTGGDRLLPSGRLFRDRLRDEGILRPLLVECGAAEGRSPLAEPRGRAGRAVTAPTA